MGFLSAIYGLVLNGADSLRDRLIAGAPGATFAGLLFVIALCAAGTALAAWLVRRYSPYASGSGLVSINAKLTG